MFKLVGCHFDMNIHFPSLALHQQLQSANVLPNRWSIQVFYKCDLSVSVVAIQSIWFERTETISILLSRHWTFRLSIWNVLLIWFVLFRFEVIVVGGQDIENSDFGYLSFIVIIWFWLCKTLLKLKSDEITLALLFLWRICDLIVFGVSVYIFCRCIFVGDSLFHSRFLVLLLSEYIDQGRCYRVFNFSSVVNWYERNILLGWTKSISMFSHYVFFLTYLIPDDLLDEGIPITIAD